MKINIKKELHEENVLELEKQLVEIEKELSQMKLDHQMGRVKNTSGLTLKRQEVAIVKTIINEKKLLGELEDVEKMAKVEEVKKNKSKGGSK